MTSSVVHIVHSIDAEGPLYESVEAKFERLSHLFGQPLDIEPTRRNLARIAAGEIKIGTDQALIEQIVSGHLSNYMETWSEVDAMLENVMSPAFRNSRRDSRGHGWVYNWFCLDHVNFEYNPRRRDMGFHNVFDHYRELLKDPENSADGLHWHFHPMSTFHEAHRCATHYFRSGEVFDILGRKIIERDWFPSVFRAGFQSERPDSHWFIEQWFPFDLSNMALDDYEELERTVDSRLGRGPDWRLAPADWSVYNPSHDNYQIPGDCRRHIGRCLKLLNRLASVDQREMDKAFQRADGGEPTLVGVCSHDFRDLAPEVEHVRDLVAESQKKFPDVEVRYSEAQEAFNDVIGLDTSADRLELEVTLHPEDGHDVARLEVVQKRGQVFGPQPFLAVESYGKQFFHDNFDFTPSQDRWHYAFHDNTLSLDQIRKIGVAASDPLGRVSVHHLDLDADIQRCTNLG